MDLKKALILTVGEKGGIPKSIEDSKPDLIYFLHTDKSESTIEEVISTLNEKPELKVYMIDFKDKYRKLRLSKHEDTLESFNKSRNLIIKLKNEGYEILIDFTGGTKPMAVGLYLAAMGENCHYSYVGGKRTDDIGAVISGYEKITQQKDPYETYAIREFNRGMGFFNRYQFDAAKTNFIEAKNKLEDINLKERVELFIDIVTLYDSWDKFNNIVIYEDKEMDLNIFLKSKILDVIDDSDNLKNYFKKNPEFHNQLKRNLNFLNQKISNKNEDLIKDIKAYLPDLLNNAQRRIEEGKYDDAVARLYRSIELVAQLRINDRKFINEHELIYNKSFYVDKNKVEVNANPNEKMKLKSWKVYKRSQRVDNFALNQIYTLLSKLEDEKSQSLANNYFNTLKNDKNDRNVSILAHGLNPISKKSAESLFDSLFKHATLLYKNVENNMKSAKFPKFKL